MRGYILGFAAAALLAVGQASAQVPPVPAPPQGMSVGARAAWAIPAGTLLGTSSLASSFSGAVPLQLDVLYRFDRHFSAGAWFAYAPASAKNCPPGDSCSGTGTSFGLQIFYTLDAQGALRPWFGFGMGYEWLKLEQTSAGVTSSTTLSGFQWANLQVGGDFSLTARFFLGPYAALSFATFSESSPGGSIPSTDRHLHDWITVGLKATYEF